MSKIYRAVLPFVGLQFAVLLIILLFPGLITWLPEFLG